MQRNSVRNVYMRGSISSILRGVSGIGWAGSDRADLNKALFIWDRSSVSALG